MMDHMTCTRKTHSQFGCDRCVEFDYVCAVDGVNAPLDGKRRKLQRLKCDACRSAKVKCEPVDRVWPDRCNRCKGKKLPCSAPQTISKKRIQRDGQSASTLLRAEVDSNDSDENSYETVVSVRPQATTITELVQPVRTIHTPQCSLSDGVEDIYRPKSDYKYMPLKGDEIRLLEVYPGTYNQEVVCFLITERLQNCQPYQALSYRWGEDVPDKPIKILSKSASKSKSFRNFTVPMIYTRNNLFEALQQLRQPDNKVILYVNSLCINYDDPDEEQAQASRTQEIFNQASNVIVWLGTETRMSKTAFEFIPKVLDMNGFDKLVKEGLSNQCWDALVDLMRNSLFSRRWLIQELVVAKVIALQCGPNVIQWTQFSDAIALFEAKLPDIQRYYEFSFASGGPINDLRALSASTLVKVVNNIIRKTSDGKILKHLESMETLVSLLAVFEATKPLDTIISMIGLAKDGARVQSIIDKSKEIRDNYINFVAYCINSSHSRDIICQHWAPVMKDETLSYIQRTRGIQLGKTELPSWISNISGSAFGTLEDRDKNKQSWRIHGDSFVGFPSHKNYNASAGFPITTPIFGMTTTRNDSQQQEQQHTQYDGTLTTQGLTFAQITQLGPPSSFGIIFQECLEMGGWDSSSDTVPERLWRTLVADRGPNNTNPPLWYHRACLHCIEQTRGTSNSDINTGALLNQSNCTQFVADFLRRVQSVIWNRKFFLCKRLEGKCKGISSGVVGEESQFFGLAPRGTKKGDLVCIVYGCSVPVVLRRHETAEGNHFEVVGESFVYGIMDGEVREGLSDDEVAAATEFLKLR